MSTDEQALAGRVGIVTGAGRGLGRAMALGLAKHGASVVITAARERAQIETLAEEIARECGVDRALPLVADVTDEAACDRVVEAALARWGRLDILVNNAARGMKYVSPSFQTVPTKFWETDPRTWRLVIDTNVNGPFLMARSAAPVMIRAGWGRIVNVSMNHETMRRRGFTPYGPSKAALESETIIWSQDLAGTGVSVNALLPGGATMTGMIPDGISEEARKALLDPAIMVPPLLWLASPDSDGVTGQRFVAARWRSDLSPREAAEAARESSGWPS